MTKNTFSSYVPFLTGDHIRQHIHHSHDLWGGGQTQEARVEVLMARLKTTGPEMFAMSGLVDGQGQLLASLKRYYFDLSIRGKSVKTIGLGAIFTDPSLRKGGLAAQLIKIVLDEARENEGCGVGLLFSDIGTSYYERFGFRALPSFSWKCAVADLPDGEGITLLPADDNSDTLMKWHHAATKDYIIHPARTATTFALFSAINSVGSHYLLVEQGREVGYITMMPGKTLFWVDEWYAPGISANKIWGAVRKQAQESGMAEAAGWWLPWYGIANKPRERAIPMIARLDESLELGDAAMTSSCLLAATDHF